MTFKGLLNTVSLVTINNFKALYNEKDTASLSQTSFSPRSQCTRWRSLSKTTPENDTNNGYNYNLQLVARDEPDGNNNRIINVNAQQEVRIIIAILNTTVMFHL